MKPGTEQLESIPPVEQAVAEAAETTPRKPSRIKRAIARVRRSRWLRMGIALAVVGMVLLALAYGVLRVLGPKEKFAPLDLPYVQDFSDIDPRTWFISDGIWSLRQEMLAQAANLNKPADIYVPGQIVKEQPYHLSTYITFTKSTQEAGVNFNAQYPKMTTQQHQVYVARRSEDAGSDSADCGRRTDHGTRGRLHRREWRVRAPGHRALRHRQRGVPARRLCAGQHLYRPAQRPDHDRAPATLLPERARRLPHPRPGARSTRSRSRRPKPRSPARRSTSATSTSNLPAPAGFPSAASGRLPTANSSRPTPPSRMPPSAMKGAHSKIMSYRPPFTT